MGDVTGTDQIVYTSVDTVEGIKTMVQPENLDTTVPAEAAAPAPEQAPVEVPKATVPESVPAQTPQYEFVGTAHPFADPDAGPLLNPNGVDLNKPQILVNEGRTWSVGTSTEDSFDRASALSRELAKTAPPGQGAMPATAVYFVARELNALQVPVLVVKMVYTIPGSEPQIAAMEGGKMPDLPDANKFTLPTKR